jgi:hypothetical protein
MSNVRELIVWPNCKVHGRNSMSIELGGERVHKCTKCDHWEHESLCVKCNSTVDVLPESQASCILKCRSLPCGFERRELF